MSFHDIRVKYRAISFSERGKGDRFERLIQAFLQTVSWYEGTFRHVWLWREFPYKENLGGRDTGIDLVVQTVEGAESGTFRVEKMRFGKTAAGVADKSVIEYNPWIRLSKTSRSTPMTMWSMDVPPLNGF